MEGNESGGMAEWYEGSISGVVTQGNVSKTRFVVPEGASHDEISGDVSMKKPASVSALEGLGRVSALVHKSSHSESIA